MEFKEFLENLQSIRDYDESRVDSTVLGKIYAYLGEINTTVGREKGFSLILLENGAYIFNKLEGLGGYSGVMIRSPHYIGLSLSNEKAETEFLGAYFMQSVVKRLYEMDLGSCWINLRNVPSEVKTNMLNENTKNINYMLAFGKIDEKALKHKSPSIHVQNTAGAYKTDPYAIEVVENKEPDSERLAVEEIVYLYEWGKEISYEELENRGVADLFFFVRNAPSDKNMQPCRFILKDGEAYIAVLNPEIKENYVDAGILMFTTEGLAKDMGIPGKWNLVENETGSKEYALVARIEL